MRPLKPKPMKPMRCWALCTHMGTLALGVNSSILAYRRRKEAAHDVNKADGERIVKILITEVKP